MEQLTDLNKDDIIDIAMKILDSGYFAQSIQSIFTHRTLLLHQLAAHAPECPLWFAPDMTIHSLEASAAQYNHKVFTRAEIADMVMDAVKDGKRISVMELLADFDVAKATEVPERSFQEFARRLHEIANSRARKSHTDIQKVLQQKARLAQWPYAYARMVLDAEESRRIRATGAAQPVGTAAPGSVIVDMPNCTESELEELPSGEEGTDNDIFHDGDEEDV